MVIPQQKIIVYLILVIGLVCKMTVYLMTVIGLVEDVPWLGWTVNDCQKAQRMSSALRKRMQVVHPFTPHVRLCRARFGAGVRLAEGHPLR